jgi:hypothetical protein
MVTAWSWVRFGLVVASAAAFLDTAGAQQGPCERDVQTWCSTVPPGQGRIAQCLAAHQQELSPRCAGYLAELRQEAKQIGAACQPDAERLCWGVLPGQGAIASCLKSHQAEVSAECKIAIARARGGG